MLSVGFSLRAIESDDAMADSAPFEPKRSAVIIDSQGNRLGIVGEFKKSVCRGFKLPDYSAGFEVDSALLFATSKVSAITYSPLSRFPSVERDVCFQVGALTAYSELEHAINDYLVEVKLNCEFIPLDIYQAESSDTKNVTFRIKLTADDRTLSGDEVGVIMSALAGSVESSTGGTVV
jgi:phenylalanyl-tRNA synthetase beta chain